MKESYELDFGLYFETFTKNQTKMDALFDHQMSSASDTEILYILGNRDLCQSEKYEAAVAEAKRRKLTYVSFISDCKTENEEQSKGHKLEHWFGFG